MRPQGSQAPFAKWHSNPKISARRMRTFLHAVVSTASGADPTGLGSRMLQEHVICRHGSKIGIGKLIITSTMKGICHKSKDKQHKKGMAYCSGSPITQCPNHVCLHRENEVASLSTKARIHHLWLRLHCRELTSRQYVFLTGSKIGGPGSL